MQLEPAFEEFRSLVEAFLVETGMGAARFGWEACRDRSFVADMRGGHREFRLSTIAKVRRYIIDHKSNNVQTAPNPSADVEETHAPEAAA